MSDPTRREALRRLLLSKRLVDFLLLRNIVSLFIAVHEEDRSEWESFFASFGMPTALERQPSEAVGSLQIVLDPRPELDVEVVEGRPVSPRAEAIEYMYEHYAHFQSALSMLDRM